MGHMPGTPECFVMAAQQGEPGKEASILKMKGGSGCSVPWHWHPSIESIMMVSGTAHTAIKNEKPVQLAAGSFQSVPPKHVVNFVCVRECTLFVYTDGPFAIHYVDDAGKEITPDEALEKEIVSLAVCRVGGMARWKTGILAPAVAIDQGRRAAVL